VCGHEGTLTLSSPLYEVVEGSGNGTIRITAARTGGGVGAVSFKYVIQVVISLYNAVYTDCLLYHSLMEYLEVLLYSCGLRYNFYIASLMLATGINASMHVFSETCCTFLKRWNAVSVYYTNRTYCTSLMHVCKLLLL
jgi:hypothetical protein